MKYSLKRIASISCGFCLTVLLTAQEPTWLRHYGNGGTFFTFRTTWDEMAHLYGLGLVVYGEPVSFEGQSYTALGHRDIVLVKYDTSGSINWVRSAGSSCSRMTTK